jgi:hypothetical protein
MNGNDVIREPILQKIAESVPYTKSLSASIFRVFLACSATVGSGSPLHGMR